MRRGKNTWYTCLFWWTKIGIFPALIKKNTDDSKQRKIKKMFYSFFPPNFLLTEPTGWQLPLCCHSRGRGPQKGEKEEVQEGKSGWTQTRVGNGWTQSPHWRIIR